MYTLKSLFFMAALVMLPSSMHAQYEGLTKTGKGDGLFVSAEFGASMSYAENCRVTDIAKTRKPSIGFAVGYSFTPVLSLRVGAGVLSQSSRCGQAVVAKRPDVYGLGLYEFSAKSLSLSALVNVSNIFAGRVEGRRLSVSVLAGGGVIKTGGFDEERLAKWNALTYYPVSPDGGTYPAGHVGLQGAYALSKPLDLTVEARVTATGNAYNGVDSGSDTDCFADFTVGLSYYIGGRKARAMKRPQPTAYTDPLLRDNNYEETPSRGDTMRTTIPFYLSFHYLNSATMRQVGRVANFLRKYPNVKLCVMGHPDTVEGQNVQRNFSLAMRRAEAVRDALVERYSISASRLRVECDNVPMSSLQTVSEWIPAVNFIME